jgi:cytidylate kinase
LARKIGYVYIDSGAMYRAATLFALREGMIRDGKVDEDALRRRLDDIHIDFRLNAEGLPETYLNGENVERQIRTMEVSNAVSPVSAIPFVRKAMVAQQQAMGERKGIVMDGRDIGTTVFPNAELKIFVTASPEVRAQRRVDELRAKGETVSLEEVLANVRTRDHIDQTRAESPLRQADDALLLDNSHLTLAEQDAWLLNAFNNAAHE